MLRKFLTGIFMLVVVVVSLAQNQPVVIPTTEFKDVAVEAKAKNIPIMITFVAEWCPYCKVIEEEQLKPMIKSGEYVGKVIIIKSDIDDRDLNQKYDISMVPTIIFVDSNGKELAERIVGVPTLDFLGQMVDESINTSKVKLRK